MISNTIYLLKLTRFESKLGHTKALIHNYKNWHYENTPLHYIQIFFSFLFFYALFCYRKWKLFFIFYILNVC